MTQAPWTDQRTPARLIAQSPGQIVVLNDHAARVQSQSHPERTYNVTHIGESWACECDHYLEVGRQCQHVLATRFYLQAQHPDGTTATMPLLPDAAKNAYNAAQTNEVRLFDSLLADLMAGIEEPAQGMGRPRIPLRDALFCATQKVYSQLSSRRATGLFGNAAERGQLDRAPCFSVSSRLLNRKDATPILHDLIEQAAKPLAALEDSFAVDSTGFRTTTFGSYCQEKHGQTQKNIWLKAHFLSGVKTHAIVKVAITDSNGKGSGDSPNFAPLVLAADAAGFNLQEVSADKAYSSRANHDVVGEVGGKAFIPFKSNATGKQRGSQLWRKAFHMFQANRAEFDARYHKRSSVESTNSAIKRKFGDYLRSKNRIAQENELLCKVLAYNLTVLIREAYESGVDLNTLKQKSPDWGKSGGSAGL